MTRREDNPHGAQLEEAEVPCREVRLLRTLRLQPVDATPVWFMRQAGRSLPEYRAIREKYSLLEICRRPEICAEVTVQPVRRLGVDAAILFADIMLPLLGAGVELEIVEGVGPVIAHPVRSAADLDRLRPLVPAADIPFVLDSIRCTLQELGGSVPLIGFSGAPFTLASYLIEGRSSRDFAQTKHVMYGAPQIWHGLMQWLVDVVIVYLQAQVEAGVHALQIFDSWAGALSVDDYCRYVQPYSCAVFDALDGAGVPLIHFATSSSALLEAMSQAGGSTISLDWRIPVDVGWRRVGHDLGVQGNLDPLVLRAPWEIVERESAAIMRRASGRNGHVFNLGHGIHPQTSPDVLARLVHFVHEWTARETG